MQQCWSKDVGSIRECKKSWSWKAEEEWCTSMNPRAVRSYVDADAAAAAEQNSRVSTSACNTRPLPARTVLLILIIPTIQAHSSTSCTSTRKRMNKEHLLALGRLIAIQTIGMTIRTATECLDSFYLRLTKRFTKLIVLIAFLNITVTSQTTKQPTKNVLDPK